MLENFYWSHKTLNWQKICELGVFGNFFCSSGELTETEVQAEI